MSEAQERRRLVPEMGEHEFARCVVLDRDPFAGRRVDQLGVDEPARAEMHTVLLLALAPERDPDVSDSHGLGDTCAPALLQPRPQRWLTAARLAGDQDSLDARASQVEPTP